MVPYLKMKGELEDAVKALDFEHTVILRPGLILGSREKSRPAEFVLQKIAGLTSVLGFKDAWAQDAEIIGRAAISAGMKALEGGEKVWQVEQKDIVRLGRTEWKV
jgi:uncharacterized protein YbjT (DUF2867 family)